MPVRAHGVEMGKYERVQNTIDFDKTGVSDSLKGLLMDKGPKASNSQLYFLLAKLVACKSAIRQLCIHHNHVIAKSYGNRFLSLYCFESSPSRAGTGTNKFVPLEHVNDELKVTCYAHWLFKKDSVSFSGGQLIHSNKAFPFHPAHPTHEILRDILLQHAPRYYEAIAAVENVRITLNNMYTVLKVAAQGVMAANAVSDHEGPMGYFTATNRRESEKLFAQLDKDGELVSVLASLFKDR